MEPRVDSFQSARRAESVWPGRQNSLLSRTSRNCRLDGTKYVPPRGVWWGESDLHSPLARLAHLSDHGSPKPRTNGEYHGLCGGTMVVRSPQSSMLSTAKRKVNCFHAPCSMGEVYGPCAELRKDGEVSPRAGVSRRSMAERWRGVIAGKCKLCCGSFARSGALRARYER